MEWHNFVRFLQAGSMQVGVFARPGQLLLPWANQHVMPLCAPIDKQLVKQVWHAMDLEVVVKTFSFPLMVSLLEFLKLLEVSWMSSMPFYQSCTGWFLSLADCASPESLSTQSHHGQEFSPVDLWLDGESPGGVLGGQQCFAVKEGLKQEVNSDTQLFSGTADDRSNQLQDQCCEENTDAATEVTEEDVGRVSWRNENEVVKGDESDLSDGESDLSSVPSERDWEVCEYDECGRW